MSQTNESSVTWSNLGPELLDRTPRYLIYFLIFYAPFCYGLRDGVGEEFFVSVAFVAFFIHCWKCYLDDRWPRVPGWLLFCMSLIALQGLWMCLNADSYHRWHRELITIRIFIDPPPFPNLPGSRDLVSSPIQFFSQLAVFTLMLITIDTARNVRKKLLTAMATCASVLALVGICMKLPELELVKIFWQFETESPYRTVFGPYRNHANAATFLVMGLALSLGILSETQASKDRSKRTLAFIGTVLIIVAIFTNTSRAGWLLAAIVAVLFIPKLVSLATRSAHNIQSRLKLLISVAVTVLGIIVAIGITFSADPDRMFKIERATIDLSNRFPLPLLLEMAEEAPALGFGPGTFSLVFPKYQLSSPELYPSDMYLNEAHQDYFQLYLDWGPIAFTAWIIIFLTPGSLTFLSSSKRYRTPMMWACFSGTATVLIHACIDFPLQVTSLLLFFSLLLAFLIAESETRSVIRTVSPKRLLNNA